MPRIVDLPVPDPGRLGTDAAISLSCLGPRHEEHGLASTRQCRTVVSAEPGLIAHIAALKALRDMDEEERISNERSQSLNERSQSAGTTNEAGTTVVILLNAVTVALGGLYVSTRSVSVTTVAAGLVAILVLCLTFSRGNHR